MNSATLAGIREDGISKMKLTVLHRSGGVWDKREVGLLVNGLRTEASQLQKFPEYIVLFGHFTKEETLKATRGGQDYTATQITGGRNKDLPFPLQF